MDNEKQVSDSRYENIMGLLTKLASQAEKQPTVPISASTVHSGTVHGGTVHSPTVSSAGTVHSGTIHSATSSGITQNPPFIPITNHFTTPIPTTLTSPNFTRAYSTIPIFSPTIPASTLPPHSTPFRTTAQRLFPNPHYMDPPYYTAPPLFTTSQPFSIPQFPQLSYPQQPQNPSFPPFRTPKLELAMFDGSNPLEWSFQAEKFFTFYNLPPENRLSMMSFYMKGETLAWFKWMHQNNELLDWISFTKALELRFGPSTYANHQAELFKLKQTHLVVEYQAQFENLGNQVVGLSRDAILNCFISGLTPEIQSEIAIHKPVSISQAIGLAKLIESKIRNTKPKFNKPFTPTKRRAQGLCFNCDEKFIPDHKCTAGKFLLLVDDEGGETEDLMVNDDTHTLSQDIDDTYFKLSPQAANGHFSPKTLKFNGSIKGLSVAVLIDTGSTHNILQPRIAQHLKLPTQQIPNFSVMVGNGSKLSCSGVCPKVPIKLQHNSFSIPFHLLPIEGADVVLGMEWLRTLGPLMADFSIPKISFTHNNNNITITGDNQTLIQPSSYNNFCHLIQNDSIASIHLLLYQPSHEQEYHNEPNSPNIFESLPKNLPTEITQLITSHSAIFTQPKGLPPTRPHDHHIPILPNTAPVNVKPYRYPHSQKDAMTSIIQEMLHEGIIKPSNNPYSSPVLSLNAVTVRDRFPIPTIDELFDELGSATIFSKIDLRSGYHQIRVSPKDTHKIAFRTFDGHYEFLLVLELLLSNQFYAKLSKCVFCVPSVDYLGHIISSDGVTPYPAKIKAILDWPKPRSLTALRGFLGLAEFYRRFVHHYASLTAPLTDLLHMTKLQWNTEADSAFTTLKRKMTETPVLALPDFAKPFVLETDASGVAVGAILSQDSHLITFFSKKLCTRLQASSVYVREMFAIT
ncbi:uncharacterized protein LOC131634786 [Vicia villosa]|uniref:uncharacterized protein LOC131634786 n=1 Tax=Vicia villosa TaxID=3911 RepID=UPI00273AE627|nr:uncharacterized protein LOC131634786 [Vicia villosa]